MQLLTTVHVVKKLMKSLNRGHQLCRFCQMIWVCGQWLWRARCGSTVNQVHWELSYAKPWLQGCGFRFCKCQGPKSANLPSLSLCSIQFRCSLLHNDTTTGIMPLLLIAYIWKCCHLDFGTGRNPLLIFVIDYR